MPRTPAVLLALFVCACPSAEPPPAEGEGGDTDGVSEAGEDSPTGGGEAGTMDAPGSTSAPGTTSDAEPPPADFDGDEFPDDIDLCPSVPSATNDDEDRDGIGDACDLCRRQPSAYNAGAGDAPVYMQVRNIPHQTDVDRDGIGDVCDNCVVRGNCGGFGDAPDQAPAGIGDEVPFADVAVCQVDVDAHGFIGDACVAEDLPLQLPDAAGPVGLGDPDDFDQDGIINIEDKCPRVPVVRVDCANDDDCDGVECTGGVCNHRDSDNDNVGEPCDTCPSIGNPKQILDGGVQEDDPDGDFMGSACESAPACSDRSDPRPIGFFDLSVAGECCVLLFDEATVPADPGLVMIEGEMCTVVDPALPLRRVCSDEDEQVLCRRVPDAVLTRPGVGVLPPGCMAIGEPLTLGSPGIESHDDLYKFACRLPPLDRDFDGLGDACDLCPRAFDPDNGETFCHGDYDPAVNQAACP